MAPGTFALNSIVQHHKKQLAQVYKDMQTGVDAAAPAAAAPATDGKASGKGKAEAGAAGTPAVKSEGAAVKSEPGSGPAEGGVKSELGTPGQLGPAGEDGGAAAMEVGSLGGACMLV